MSTLKTLRSRVKEKAGALLGDGEARKTSSLSAGSSKDPVQVEPKTYFANERTFIQWISAALLLLTVSSIMMGSGNYNGTSSVIAFSSLILVTYAAFVYFRRVKLLQSGEAYGYLDFIGPTILATGVGVGVFIVFADAVKGSEFLPWATTEEGRNNRDKDDRRFLLAPELPEEILSVVAQGKLQEHKGTCVRHAIQGINFLEYQPRDVLLLDTPKTPSTTTTTSNLMVATPQSLMMHSLGVEGQEDIPSKELASEIPNVQLQSITRVSDNRLLALSTGPDQTELLAFDDGGMNVVSRVTIQESASKNGSMAFVPSLQDENPKNRNSGKLYVYLDGTMYTYRLGEEENDSTLAVSRIGSINMKVLNRGQENSILAMEHFEGVTYLLRPTTLEAWDMQSATFLSQVDLPSAGTQPGDQWVGLALERNVNSKDETIKNLRHRHKTSSVMVHMSLDSFPPQLWSFRLTETQGPTEHGHSVMRFPSCAGGMELN